MKARFVVTLVIASALAMQSLSATAAEPITSAPRGIEASETSASFAAASSTSFEAERALILQQTNALRTANGLAPLRLNLALNEIAQDWSVQQARVSVMSHRPNFTAMYPGGWSRAAENVAAGYVPNSVVTAWANSPGHRANILSTNTDIGIGVAANASGRLYYTQNFGRYSSAPSTLMGSVSRIAGTDRFATSAQVSFQTFPSGARTVYVASGLDFPDALSAAALAGADGGPLLLVQPGAVPAVILTELRRLAPERIVVAGGAGVISDSVLAKLRTVTPSVTRVFGADRYETSRALALHAYGQGGAHVAYVATGAGFADALAAGPAAASVDAPVILVRGGAASIDGSTLALLRQLGTTRVVIVGGTGVISEGIRLSLERSRFVVERIAGVDRYETAARIATAHFASATRSYVSTGTGFADALSGGAAAGAVGAALFTSLPACVPAFTRAAIMAQNPAELVLLGGLGALQPAVAGLHRC